MSHKHNHKHKKHKKHSHHHDFSQFDMDHTVRFGSVIVLNGLLTIAQVFAGLFSGSLTLLADALHNFSDMLSLLIALVSHIISKKPANSRKTFSYKRAEIIGAFVNVILLFSTGLYLIFEAILRFLHPHVIEGGIVVWVAFLALFVDLATAIIVYFSPKKTMNIRVAFIHNLSDALASFAVIITGLVIIKYDFYIIDSLMTFVIAGYVIYHAYLMLPKIVNILMNNVPNNVIYGEIEKGLLKIKDVKNIHHLHIWKLDEERVAMESHVVVDNHTLKELEVIKKNIKNFLKEKHNIYHSSIEFECCDNSECEFKG
jgi:cobalt-zinc-cadmium efflux system protein